MGLFLDRIKENREVPKFKFTENYKEFKEFLCNSNMAFLTFQYAIDGVSIEVKKYTKIFKDQYNISNIHYIAGKFFRSQKNDTRICKKI